MADISLKRKALKKMMVDLGYKYDMDRPMATKESSRINYPSLHLHKKVPKWLMSKDIGKSVAFKAIGRIVSKSINEGSRGKDESVTVDIHKIGE